MPIVDANVILRYLLGDHAELSEKAKAIIDENAIKIPIEVLCEVVFVLKSVYKMPREEISEELRIFFAETQSAISHKSAVLRALEIYSERSIDFVDCILAGYNKCENAKIYTFDKQLEKLLDKQR